MNVERLTAEGLGLLMLGSTMLLAAGYALQWLLKNPGDRLAAAVWALVTAALLPALALAPFRPMCVWRILPAAEPARVFERRDIAPSPALAGARPLAGVDREPARQPARGVPHAAESQAATIRFQWGPALLVAYAAGLLFVSGRLALGHVVARRLIKRSSAPPADVGAVWDALAGADARRVAVRIHAGVGAPRLVGGGRACILVPARLTRPGEVAGLRFALAHELAHYRHGDLRRWRLVNVTCAALWFHPLAWRLRHAVRECQEVLADAAACGELRVEYAAFLVHAARCLTAEPQAAGLAMARRGASLEPRIRALLAPNLARPLPRPLRVAALALIGCGLLAFASVRLEAQAVEEQQPPAEPAQEVKPAASESSGPSVFELVVVDAETGKPLSNASAGLLRRGNDPLSPSMDEATRSHADTEGQFRFLVPKSRADGFYLIEAPGYTPESAYYSAQRALAPVTVRMFAAVQVAGRVVDSLGPVSGASVIAVGGGDKFGPSFHVISTNTDDAGRFSFPLPRGFPGMLAIRAKEHPYFERRFDVPPGDLGDIQLDGGVWVEGQVRTSRGEPARVSVALAGPWRPRPEAWTTFLGESGVVCAPVETDHRGAYRLGPVPPGQYSVRVNGQGDWQGVAPSNNDIRVEDQPVTLDFRLLPTIAAAVTLRREDGTLLRGVRGSWKGICWDQVPVRITAEDGERISLGAWLPATWKSMELEVAFSDSDLTPGETLLFMLTLDGDLVEQSSHVVSERGQKLKFDLPRFQPKARVE